LKNESYKSDHTERIINEISTEILPVVHIGEIHRKVTINYSGNGHINNYIEIWIGDKIATTWSNEKNYDSRWIYDIFKMVERDEKLEIIGI
jgi:hypothetical protein